VTIPVPGHRKTQRGDTEAGWTKSGWHGWVYGWKLHLAIAVAEVWIPLSAKLTAADAADNEVAPLSIEQLPGEAHFVSGDTHYDAPNVHFKSNFEVHGQVPTSRDINTARFVLGAVFVY
jgi:hypothetical protein